MNESQNTRRLHFYGEATNRDNGYKIEILYKKKQFLHYSLKKYVGSINKILLFSE